MIAMPPWPLVLNYGSTMYTTFIIGKHISCTLFYTFFCTFHKKRWNNAFFVPSVQGQVRDGISSDNNSVQVRLGTLGSVGDTWRAPTPELARANLRLGAPTCEFAGAKAREANFGTFLPCRSVFSTRGA